MFCGFLITLGLVAIVLIQNAKNNIPEEAVNNPFPVTNPFILVIIGMCVIMVVQSLIIPKVFLKKAPKPYNPQSILFTEIIRMAILEAIGILGFVAALLTQMPYLCIPFVLVAIILILRQPNYIN